MTGLCELRESTVPVSVVPIKPHSPRRKNWPIPISAFCSDQRWRCHREKVEQRVKPTELKYSSKVAAGLAVLRGSEDAHEQT